VIFDVSGTITLTTDVFISNAVNANDPGDGTKDFLTVAGQTAPSPGITIRGAGLVIRASDVLIQHLRIRPGVLGTGNHDAITITGRRIVVDHVSTSWAGNGGKNIDIYNGAQDVTISNSITSEAFPYGMLVSEDTKASILRSLFAHNLDRNPHVKGGARTVMVNNEIYNAGGTGGPGPVAFSYWANVNPTRSTASNLGAYIGNTAKLGPTGTGTRVEFDATLAAGSSCYLSDNAFTDGFFFDPGTGMVQVGSPPIALPAPLSILTSSAVEAYLIANAGARPKDRDPVDTRIINDVINRTGNSILSNEGQVGGYPSLAQTTRVLTLPANYTALRSSGYTVLEEDLLFPLAVQLQGP